MSLISLRNVHLTYGFPLLDGINFTLNKGERVAVVGRNGTGKSTFLKLIKGLIKPDDGEVSTGENIHVSLLDQEVPLGMKGPIFNVIASGLGATGEVLIQYHELLEAISHGADESALLKLEELQHHIESKGAWDIDKKISNLVTRLALPGNADMESLSGGLKRRVLLARALIAEPEVLLLDEPTNHLDLEAILWLEQFISTWPGTLMFITHDRTFLQKLATRIIELDRGRLTDFPGDYPTYLVRKQELLDNEARENSEFDKKLAQEEVWIRQGIKARRTRDMGRVRRLVEMRQERNERRSRMGQVNMQVQSGERSGKLVVEMENVSFSYPDANLIKNFSTTILRGDKVGIIGPNGTGKTTLLRILLGQLEPTTGRVRLGTNLQIAYFDQYRLTLDEEATVIDNVAQGSDRVTVNGRNMHVIGYLQDFLFSPDRARQPVKSLSGGERNRLLLARLFTQPANLLVLDEPTNDLDVETLDLLEEIIVDYTGTVLVVSHDRTFLNNVVTSIVAFEGEGEVNEYVGGYDDWIRQRNTSTAAPALKPAIAPPKAAPPAKASAVKPRKLSFKELKELDELPALIEKLESDTLKVNQEMTSPEFYKKDKDAIAATHKKLADIESSLSAAYQRWEALEELKNSLP